MSLVLDGGAEFLDAGAEESILAVAELAGLRGLRPARLALANEEIRRGCIDPDFLPANRFQGREGVRAVAIG